MFDSFQRVFTLRFVGLAGAALLCLVLSQGRSQAQTYDYQKIWTTVGSAGTVDEADSGKVEFNKSAVQLKGSGIIVAEPLANTGQPPSRDNIIVHFPTQSAVIRYNVTPVDGLFMGSPYGPGSAYGMTVRYWATGLQAQVVVRLIEVDLYTGQETERLKFNSASFPGSSSYQTNSVSVNQPNWKYDFVQKAYYIEATLTKSAVVVNGAAGLSIVKLNAFYPIY